MTLQSDLPNCIARIQNQSREVEADGMKLINLSDNIGNWTTLEILLGIKFSGHFYTSPEASN